MLWCDTTWAKYCISLPYLKPIGSQPLIIKPEAQLAEVPAYISPANSSTSITMNSVSTVPLS